MLLYLPFRSQDRLCICLYGVNNEYSVVFVNLVICCFSSCDFTRRWTNYYKKVRWVAVDVQRAVTSLPLIGNIAAICSHFSDLPFRLLDPVMMYMQNKLLWWPWGGGVYGLPACLPAGIRLAGEAEMSLRNEAACVLGSSSPPTFIPMAKACVTIERCPNTTLPTAGLQSTAPAQQGAESITLRTRHNQKVSKPRLVPLSVHQRSLADMQSSPPWRYI
jgi:hypothetical protein